MSNAKRDYKAEFVRFVLEQLAIKPKVPTTILIKRFKQKTKPDRYSHFPNNFELEEVIRTDIIPMLSLAIQNADTLHASLKAFINKEWEPTNFLEQKIEFMERFLGEAMKAVHEGKLELAESKIKLLEPQLPEIKSSPRYEPLKQSLEMLYDLIESKRQLSKSSN